MRFEKGNGIGMRRRHLLVKETGSTACGITQVSHQEKHFMQRDFWNKYINCKKCLRAMAGKSITAGRREE
jgi:hypothetical protein